MNQLYHQLNPTRPLSNNMVQMIKNFKSLKNPQAMIQQMLNQNPKVASLIQAANGNPEQAFRNLAKEMNVDPNEIINLLR